MPELPCATHIRSQPKIEGAKPERELLVKRVGWHGTMQVAVTADVSTAGSCRYAKSNARGSVSC